tara:strand:- start:268 stop:477 length:210 start_codon:yes stop_codon:yes gene_type:complete
MAIDTKELAEYLHKEMESGDEVNTTFHLIKVPTVDELEFWIQQFKCKDFIGHSEWSEKYQKNMWVKDND